MFGPMMCSFFINFNTKLREGASFGQPITEYDPASMGYRDFIRLARELIAAGGPELIPTTLLRQADDLAERAEKLLATSKPLFPRNGGTSAAVAATPAEIQRKIDDIYGVRATDDGVAFTAFIPGAADVRLAGDFNDWSPETTPMAENGQRGCFHALLPLKPGRYRYRYVVDGRWVNDPHNAYVESNPFGGLDSVVEVS
jgi:hypothetical protein